MTLKTSLLILVWLIVLFASFAFVLYFVARAFASSFDGIGILQQTDYMFSSSLIAIVYLIVRRYIGKGMNLF